jgi:hypothetical protein
VERIAAQAIAASLEAAIARLSESLVHAENGLPPHEFALFQKQIGLAIGHLSQDLLDPIYAEYPDVAPPGVL